MKRMKLILGFFALVAMSLTACNKDYDCVCNYADGSQEVTTFEDADKSEAEEACEVLDAFAQMSDGSCELD